MNTQKAVTAQRKTGAVTPRAELKAELQGDSFRKAVAQVLPKHLTPDRFVRIALLAMTRTPKLAECDRPSFFNALMQLSQFGLEPDGRRAHLIPFENRKRGVVECQLIIDWKGLAELAMRSGVVSFLHADVVSEGDLFDYNAGQIVAHVPWFIRRDRDKPAAPGEVFAVYALARFKDGSSKAEVLSLSEVEAVRDGSQGFQMFQKGIAKSSPWDSHFFEMAKKTAFRRLSKWLPLSPEFRDAVDIDDKADSVVDVDTVSGASDFQIHLAGTDDGKAEAGEVIDAEIPPDFLPAPQRNTNQDPEPEVGNDAGTPQAGGSAAPAEAPPQAATAQPAPAPEKPKQSAALTTIVRQLARAEFTEGDALTQVHKMFSQTQGCNSLGEVEQIAPNVINALVKSWPTFIAAIRQAKGLPAAT